MEYIGEMEIIYSVATIRFSIFSKTIANQNSTNMSPQFAEMFSVFDS